MSKAKEELEDIILDLTGRHELSLGEVQQLQEAEKKLEDLERIKCPKCKSSEVTSCPGGSCLKPIPGIDYICMECLYEFGKKEVSDGI